MSDDDPNQHLPDEAGSFEFEPAAPSLGYDNYRSLRDPRLLIFVPHDAVPPFRFKAGGWELLQAAIEVGSAMKARITETGFFMFRVNEDKSGGIEVSEPPPPDWNLKRGETPPPTGIEEQDQVSDDRA
jgi:hypothetical protein